jgi:diadenylate cyclase
MTDGRGRTSLDQRLTGALQLVAPGMPLREGIDNIIRGKSGALIVIGDVRKLAFLFSGGFKLECDFKPNKVYELAKMDGAIIINRAISRIHRANVQLMPDATIESLETGTRHRTAERVAKQTGALVVSISQDRDVVTLYVDDLKYSLTEIRVLLAKADQALQTLEKYRSRLDQVADSLTALEFEDAVTLHDVAVVTQRAEMVMRVAAEIERYLVELGSEGRLIAMQLEELMTGVSRDREALIRDYLPGKGSAVAEVAESISRLSADELFEVDTVINTLGYRRKAQTADYRVSPRGYRVLAKLPKLPASVVDKLVKQYGKLQSVIIAGEDELVKVEGIGRVRAREIGEGLVQLRELTLAEKYSFR